MWLWARFTLNTNGLIAGAFSNAGRTEGCEKFTTSMCRGARNSNQRMSAVATQNFHDRDPKSVVVGWPRGRCPWKRGKPNFSSRSSALYSRARITFKP